jgi:hypothetical protein
MHNRDRELLVYLVKILGVGSISYLESKNQTSLIFSKRDLVTVILPLIKIYNLKFLTSHRFKQFEMLNYILNNSIVH